MDSQESDRIGARSLDDYISIKTKEYIDNRLYDLKDLVETKLAANEQKSDLQDRDNKHLLEGFKKEYSIAHDALIHDYQRSLEDVKLAKDQVDRHFELNNNLLARLDKQGLTFATIDNTALMIKAALAEYSKLDTCETSSLKSKIAELRALVVFIGGILITFLILHLLGKT